jgi:hypothetical protein
MKSTVFWDMTPCSQKKFTDVSEEHVPPSSQAKNNSSRTKRKGGKAGSVRGLKRSPEGPNRTKGNSN